MLRVVLPTCMFSCADALASGRHKAADNAHNKVFFMIFMQFVLIMSTMEITPLSAITEKHTAKKRSIPANKNCTYSLKIQFLSHGTKRFLPRMSFPKPAMHQTDRQGYPFPLFHLFPDLEQHLFRIAATQLTVTCRIKMQRVYATGATGGRNHIGRRNHLRKGLDDGIH